MDCIWIREVVTRAYFFCLSDEQTPKSCYIKKLNHYSAIFDPIQYLSDPPLIGEVQKKGHGVRWLGKS